MNRLWSESRVLQSLAHAIGKTVLRVLGWRICDTPPKIPAFVVVVAPHTSRWDAIILFSAMAAQRLPAYWLGKHSLFRWPFGLLLRRWGGIPVDRSRGGHALPHAEHLLQHAPRPLVIFPEGTRASTKHWRRGFYALSQSTGAPIVPLALDFRLKQLRWGTPLNTQESVESVMDSLRSFFSTVHGRNQDRASPVRVADESVE